MLQYLGGLLVCGFCLFIIMLLGVRFGIITTILTWGFVYYYFLRCIIIFSCPIELKEKINNFILKLKGKKGEKQVQKELEILKQQKNIKVYNSLYLQKIINNQFISSEIDHVIVTDKKQIILIETKNIAGTYHFDINDNYWKCIGFKKNNKWFTRYTKQNPIKQNEKHLQRFSEFLKENNLEGYTLHNLVVMTNKKFIMWHCTNKDNIPYCIANLSNMNKLIYNTIENKKCDISNLENDELVKKLDVINKYNKENNEEVKEKHLRYIYENKRNFEP